MSKRPTSLAEMRECMAPMFDIEGVKKGLALKLRPTDVVVTPFGKSGTTWTQQIVHTLRTRGDMDFDDISRVVPWIETAHVLGLDLDAEQKANPRAFKSHLDANRIPKGGRYINVVRNPADAAVSLYKFQEGWFLEPGSVGIDEFVQAQLGGSKNYYTHLLTWWARRNDADVLFFAYEKMLVNPADTIRRIAEFIGVELDEELLQITLEHSSMDFMLEHKDRFDDAMMRKCSEELAGLPPGSDTSKVRLGKSGTGSTLSDESIRLFDEAWKELITPEIGFNSYQELLAEVS